MLSIFGRTSSYHWPVRGSVLEPAPGRSVPDRQRSGPTMRNRSLSDSTLWSEKRPAVCLGWEPRIVSGGWGGLSFSHFFLFLFSFSASTSEHGSAPWPKIIFPAPPFTSFRGARSLSRTISPALFFCFSVITFGMFVLDDTP